MGSHDWESLLASGDIEKLKNDELKAYLKEAKQPQNGEKGTLIARIRMHVESRKLDVDLGDGQKDPFLLGLPALRKACAKFGASPIGDRDEMLRELVEKLKQQSGGGKAAGGAGAGPSGEQGAAGAAGGPAEAVEVAKRVLQLGEKEDYEGILSVLGEKVDSASSTGAHAAQLIRTEDPHTAQEAQSASGSTDARRPVPGALPRAAVLRKQYLRISAMIHPDKLGRRFEGATKAFQVLVSAFERLSQPDLYLREQEEAAARKGGKKQGAGAKPLRIVRSNENCSRTAVRCPRCREVWGTPLSGLPNYAYNFLMQGYKQYCCDTCLLSFGCVTAIHECPHCKREFPYHPNDYHRQIKCEHCSRQFGFYLYPVSEKVENELREELKKEQERWQRKREQSVKRAARAERNTVVALQGAGDEQAVAEGAFSKGLSSVCPRCGQGDFERTADQAAHLQQCTDKAAHRAFAKRKREEEAAAAAKAARVDAQDVATSRAAFEFLGGRTQDVWRLNEAALRQLAAEYGLSTDGTHEKLVARIVRHRNALESAHLLTDGTTAGAAARGAGGARGGGLTRDSLPENLEMASEELLRATCAAHGLKPRGGKLAPKKELIRVIEKELYKHHEDVLFLE